MKKIIIIIVIVLAGLGVFWYFYSMHTASNTSPGTGKGLNYFFPFGLSDNHAAGTDTTSGPPPTRGGAGGVSGTVSYDPLIKLSNRSVVGMTIISGATFSASNPAVITATTTATSSGGTNISTGNNLPIVRFAEHGTGYIYDVDARAQNETKKTGTTIVRAYEAYFGNNGQNVIFRYLKDDNATIQTYLGSIVPPDSATSGQFATVKGTFLPEGITDLVMSPDNMSFAYLFPTPNGTSGISIKTDGTNKKQLFASSYDEWLLDWKRGVLTATTKAAGGVPGYVYSVSGNGIFQKIIGGVNGLTTNASPDGRLLLYDTSTGNNISTFVRQTNGNSIKLDIATLPEKCVWSNNSVAIYCAVPISIDAAHTYPDDWYQGLAHFNDALWKIDATSGTVTKISTLDGLPIDAVDLMLDQNENFLVFKNNNDGTPWSFYLRPIPVSKTVVPTVVPFPLGEPKTN